MTQRAMIAAAAASLLTTLLVANPAFAADDTAGKEKCYGIAKVGQNDCANLSGSHSCAGQTKMNDDPADWKYVKKGECKAMKGLTQNEAKMKVKKT